LIFLLFNYEKSGAKIQTGQVQKDRIMVLSTLCDVKKLHTAWDLDLNGKRPGITSDGNFSSYLIVRSWYNHFWSFSMGGNGGLHWQGMANLVNQPISEKLLNGTF
jgi:hypothetical protein